MSHAKPSTVYSFFLPGVSLPLSGMLGLSSLGDAVSPPLGAGAAFTTPFPRLDPRLRIVVTDAGLVVSSSRLKQAFIIEWGQHGSVASCPLPVIEDEPEQTAAASGQESVPSATSMDARGLVGILRLFCHDYLVCITKTEQAASLPSHASSSSTPARHIWAIRQVLAVPLEHEAATAAILKHQKLKEKEASSATDSEAEEESDLEAVEPLQPEGVSTAASSAPKKQRNPFHWTPFRLRKENFNEEGLPPPMPTATSPQKMPRSATGLSDRDKTSRAALDHRIVIQLSRDLRHGMYTAYTSDATQALQAKGQLLQQADEPALGEPMAHEPLWKRADQRFWWNRWLTSPLVEAKLDAFVYPIFQCVCLSIFFESVH